MDMFTVDDYIWASDKQMLFDQKFQAKQAYPLQQTSEICLRDIQSDSICLQKDTYSIISFLRFFLQNNRVSLQLFLQKEFTKISNANAQWNGRKME